jgi:hypothetical protein
MPLSSTECQRRCQDNPANHPKIKKRQAARRDVLKEQGLCSRCAVMPRRPSKTTCGPCGAKANGYTQQAIRERLSQGLCIRCGNAPIRPAVQQAGLHQRVCQTCYLRKVSRKRLSTERYWKAIYQKLLAQQQVCAYTGDAIVLGVNDSLDHILPALRFPEHRHDPTNVEWVTRKVNEMKRDRTPEEFLTLISTIFNYRGLCSVT